MHLFFKKLLIFCILWTSEGFWPGKWHDDIDPQSRKHADITRYAMFKIYAELRLEFPEYKLPENPEEVSDFMEVVELIADNNMMVDEKFADNSEYHFDNQDFEGGDLNLKEKVILLQEAIERKDFHKAREWMGIMLHSVQDFYSHSNWLELGNQSPNRRLGRVEESDLGVRISNGPTCGDCRYADLGESRLIFNQMPATAMFKVFRLGADYALFTYLYMKGAFIICPDNVTETNELTSGYYHKTDAEFKNPGKCSHGGYLPNIVEDATRKTRALGGINKDSQFQFWSYKPNLHMPAAVLAEQATYEHFKYIRDLVGDSKTFGNFLGLLYSFVFVVDIRPSMENDMSKVKSLIRYMIENAEEDKTISFLLVVSGGKPRIDTAKGLRWWHDTHWLETTERARFLDRIDNLAVRRSITGLNLNTDSDPFGPPWGFTPNANAPQFPREEISGKDVIYDWPSTYQAISVAATRAPKQSVIHLFSDSDDTAESSQERQACLAVINERHSSIVWHQTSSAVPYVRSSRSENEPVRFTEGHKISVMREELDKTLIKSSIGSKTEQKALLQQFPILQNSVIEFFVDSFLDKILLEIVLPPQSTPVIKLRDPNNSEETLKDYNGDLQIFKLIPKPQSGTWKLEARNAYKARYKLYGWSKVGFSGKLYKIAGAAPDLPGQARASHPGLMPFTEEPIAKTLYNFFFRSGCDPLEIQLVNADNTSDVIEQYSKKQIRTFEGQGPTEQSLMVKIPETGFRIALVCLDGRTRFNRILKQRIQPTSMHIQFSNCKILARSKISECVLFPGAVAVISVTVTAYVEDTYEFQVIGKYVKELDSRPRNIKVGGNVTLEIRMEIPSDLQETTPLVILFMVKGQKTNIQALRTKHVSILLDRRNPTGPVTPRPGTLTPTRGSVTPRPGALTPRRGSVTPRPGALTPKRGPVTPRPGSLTPRRGTERPHRANPATTTNSSTDHDVDFATTWIAFAVTKGPFHPATPVHGIKITSRGNGVPSGYTKTLQGRSFTRSDHPYYPGAAAVPVRKPSGRTAVEATIEVRDSRNRLCEPHCYKRQDIARTSQRRLYYVRCSAVVRLSDNEENPYSVGNLEEALGKQWRNEEGGILSDSRPNYLVFRCP